MRTIDFKTYLNHDRLYLQAFCNKYNARLVDVIPNTEEFSVCGLLYVFNNQLGSFSIEGIKSSLEEKVEQTSEQR